MYLPSPLYAITFIALLFGIDLFIYVLTVYTPSITLIQYFNVLTSKFGLAIDWNVTIGTILAFHVLGFVVYALIERRLPLGHVPRRISLPIALLIIIAMLTVIAFTDLATIISLYHSFIDRFIVQPLIDMVSKFVVAPFALYAIYLIIMPNFLRFLEARRIPMVQGFLLNFIVASVVSIISLRVVNESIEILEQQGVLGTQEFALAMIALGLVAFFEFTQFAKEMKIHEAVQAPAVLQIAIWVVPLMRQLGFEEAVISTYTSMLALLLAIVIYMHAIFIMVGFILRKVNYVMIGQAIAVAFMYVIDTNIETLTPTAATTYTALIATLILTVLLIEKLRR